MVQHTAGKDGSPLCGADAGSIGTLTISRVTNGLTGDRIRIEVRDATGRFLVEISPEVFGLAVTGASGQACTVERRALPGRKAGT